MDVMCANKELTEDEDYTFIKGTEIALNVNKFYPSITEFVKNKGLKEEILLQKEQFTKQLRKTAYFTDYRAVKICGSTIKCYVLNIKKLREKNLILDNLIERNFLNKK